jgi:enoyl-CoA hydratase/carnithine racemase
MPDFEQILYEQDGRVVTLTLNRPERLNAWTARMEEEFITALQFAARDDSVGCLVVTGAGRGFCAGADIGGWANQQNIEHAHERPPWTNTNVAKEASQGVPPALFDGKPVIAAINGPAVGVGLTMAMSCDIRIASERARFSARFVRVGLSPECGSTRNLAEVAGIEAALELALTGRIIEATDPLGRKLVSRVVPHDELMPAAYALAREIASGPGEAVWIAKKLIRRNSLEQNIRTVTDFEGLAIEQLRNEPAHREAVAAFGEKREPRFNG